MGYPMAKNLRTKMDPKDTLLICDISVETTSRFQEEMEGKGPIGVVYNGAEAAKSAVSGHIKKYARQRP